VGSLLAFSVSNSSSHHFDHAPGGSSTPEWRDSYATPVTMLGRNSHLFSDGPGEVAAKMESMITAG
jgi:hypothetical protein